MTKVSKEQVQQVRLARWEVWRQMAREMKNHQILAVELLRTRGDETIAVFTVSRNGEPVQFVVKGDSMGRLSTGGDDHQGGHEHHEHHHHHHHHEHGHGHGHEHGHGGHGGHEQGHGGYDQHQQGGYQAQTAPSAQSAPGARAFAAMALAASDDPASPDIMAGGSPPPKDDPPPGITAVGGVLLATAFNVAENVPAGSTTKPA